MSLGNSSLASSTLLREKVYPNGDVLDYSYNRQGQVKTASLGNGTVHAYDYDKFGRQTQDRVTAFGTEVDQSVKRLANIYNTRGLLEKSTSYDHATVGSGTVVNEVAFSYNGFNQMTGDAQSHDGAVGGGTPTVGYAYANGSAGNTARRTSLTYPDGRIVDYGYGSGNSLDDVLSRVSSVTIQGEGQAAAVYTCAGVARYVKIASPEPGIELTYFAAPGQVTPGDSGDPYVGYDRFGRTVQMRWQLTSNRALRDGYQWGYDRASNRTWRRNLVATSGGHDEAYSYDGLYQVTSDQRGTLNVNQTGIGAVPAAGETFAYDPTGNWLRYTSSTSGVVTLDQPRGSNQANQLIQIDGSSEGIAYDGAGNMTSLRPGGEDGDDWSESRHLTWDAWNRLVAVRDESEALVGEYAYDALTRRITRTVGMDAPIHTYWSDQWKPLEERIDDATVPERQYVWGARPGHRDELILRDRDLNTDGELDERLYATMDYFNATGALDAGGDVVERYAYSAFGERRVMAPDFSPRAASETDWTFAFQGQLQDAETGYYNYGYRYYVTLLGRWVNRDPIGEVGGVNLYAMVANATIGRVDRFGLTTSDVAEANSDPGVTWREYPQSQMGGSRVTVTACGCTCVPGCKIECSATLASTIWLNIEYFGSERLTGVYGHEQRHIISRNHRRRIQPASAIFWGELKKVAWGVE